MNTEIMINSMLKALHNKDESLAYDCLVAVWADTLPIEWVGVLETLEGLNIVIVRNSTGFPLSIHKDCRKLYNCYQVWIANDNFKCDFFINAHCEKSARHSSKDIIKNSGNYPINCRIVGIDLIKEGVK